MREATGRGERKSKVSAARRRQRERGREDRLGCVSAEFELIGGGGTDDGGAGAGGDGDTGGGRGGGEVAAAADQEEAGGGGARRRVAGERGGDRGQAPGGRAPEAGTCHCRAPFPFPVVVWFSWLPVHGWVAWLGCELCTPRIRSSESLPQLFREKLLDRFLVFNVEVKGGSFLSDCF